MAVSANLWRRIQPIDDFRHEQRGRHNLLRHGRSGHTSGAGTYNYHNVDLLTLSAGNGSDDIFVESTSAGTFTIVNAQGGADTITIGGAHIDFVLGNVNVVGGFGFDTVRFGDLTTTGHDYEIDSDETVIDGSVTITYDVEILELFAGVDDDTINVNSLNANQTLEVYTGLGENDVTINLLSSPLEQHRTPDEQACAPRAATFPLYRRPTQNRRPNHVDRT